MRLASANRDEAVYGDHAETPLLGARPPKPHMSFGMGMHFCVGAMLSRLELQVAFRMLTERFTSMALGVPGEDLRYSPHFHLRGLTALPLVLEPQSA